MGEETAHFTKQNGWEYKAARFRREWVHHAAIVLPRTRSYRARRSAAVKNSAQAADSRPDISLSPLVTRGSGRCFRVQARGEIAARQSLDKIQVAFQEI